MQAVEITESACAPTPTLSVLVPVYNEIEVLPAFHQRMTAVLRASVDTYEVLYVNDGSSDGSLAWLEQLCGVDANVALVDHSGSTALAHARRLGSGRIAELIEEAS